MDVFSYALGKKAGGGGTPATLIDKNISANGTYNASSDEADGYKKVVVDVEPNLQNKSETITTNTTTTISADQGYDGLGTVSVTTNVPVGIDWSTIGYSSQPEFITSGYNYAVQMINNWDVSTTDATQKYFRDNKVIFAPNLNTSNVTNMKQMFNNCNSMLYAILTNINNVTNLNGTFYNCSSLISIKLGNATISDMSSCLGNTMKLKSADLSGIKITSSASLDYLFNKSNTLSVIDISSMDFANFSGTSNSTFFNCGTSASVDYGAYAGGIPYIYVKDATAQTWVITTANSQGNDWSTNNVVIKGA